MDPSLSKAIEAAEWDTYRRRRDSGQLDEGFLIWCARQGRDPEDALSARDYEDVVVDCFMDDENSWSWWREQGFGS